MHRSTVWLAVAVCSCLAFGCTGSGESSKSGEVDASRSSPRDVPQLDEGASTGPETATDADEGGDGGETTQGGRSCQVDGGWAPLPSPEAGAFHVRRGTFEVDGTLDEVSGRRLRFRDSSTGSDNRVDMTARWNHDGLYLGFRIEDAEIEVEESADPWRNDGVEFAIDPGGVEGSELSGDELKWIVNPTDTSSFGRPTSGTWSGADDDPADWVARSTGEGYVVEASIPASALDAPPEVGRRLPIEVVVNDRDDGRSRSLSWDGDGKNFADPGAWGWVEFASRACRRIGGGDGGPGGDAGEVGDTNRSPETEGGADGGEPEPYETIVLDPGETRTVNLSGGDTYENKLIDASAKGAGISINASGSGWTIRDVGIIGPLPSSISHVIRIQVNDSNGVGTIDHVYIEDAYHNFMFAHAHHEGHIDIENSTFIDNLRDQEDILYGSPPGNPDASWGKQTGRGGTIHIDGCYGEEIGGYGWRLGSDGSKLENSVLVDQNVAVANLWSRDVEIRNVDIVNAGIGLRLGSHIHGDKNLEPTRTVVENVEIDADTPVQRNDHQGEPPELVGSVGANPDATPPPGAPMSAKEAASGQ